MWTLLGCFWEWVVFFWYELEFQPSLWSAKVAASVRLRFWMCQRSPSESLYAADNSISCKQIWRMTFSHKFKGVGHHHLHHHSDWMVEADILLYPCTEEPAALLPRWVREQARAGVRCVCVVQLTCSAASAWCVVASRRTYSSSVVEDSFNHQPTFKIVQSNTQQFLINQSIHHSINQPINIHDWLRN